MCVGMFRADSNPGIDACVLGCFMQPQKRMTRRRRTPCSRISSLAWLSSTKHLDLHRTRGLRNVRMSTSSASHSDYCHTAVHHITSCLCAPADAQCTPVKQKMKTMSRSLQMLNVARLNVKAQKNQSETEPGRALDRHEKKGLSGRSKVASSMSEWSRKDFHRGCKSCL